MTFTEARRIRLIVPTVSWQTIAANLGSMLTPIGNPQNLYIYSHYQLLPGDFFSITAPIVLLSGAAIYLGGQAQNMEEGVKKAAELIESGAALAKLEQLAELLDPEFYYAQSLGHPSVVQLELELQEQELQEEQ
jgi:Na+/H+ antiporter NhaD/arsenite permease-like protein